MLDPDPVKKFNRYKALPVSWGPSPPPTIPSKDKNYNLMIGNENIQRIGSNCKDKYFKFVGIKFDEFLSAIFALRSVKNILPLNIRKVVYNSLIKSHLEYRILAWGSSSNSKLDKLYKLQKKQCVF